jgi:hypoxanthine phosphoribosyltransferase
MRVTPHHHFTREILISADRLKTRVAELGAEISRDYAGQDLLLICILRGSVIFLADLMRAITAPHQIEFIAVSSYGVGGRESTGNVRINYDLQSPIAGRNILIIEDIIDSGYTLKTITEMLATRHPASLRICALLDKAERRKVEIPIHYTGFRIPDEFVFGYGLDIDEYYRELPYIAAVDPAQYTPPA